ncbi:MAG: hypothetical protein DME46_00900 [Verrucomicrobia bacterium]|nr:MAG: hypothetical protein DME46_00900 [Verrucomicrobiota bacterium]
MTTSVAPLHCAVIPNRRKDLAFAHPYQTFHEDAGQEVGDPRRDVVPNIQDARKRAPPLELENGITFMRWLIRETQSLDFHLLRLAMSFTGLPR